MGWRRWLGGREADTAATPHGSERDTSKAVLAGVVPLWHAPMIVEGLAEIDITATYAERSSRRMIIGGQPSARIYVIEQDRPAAQAFIAEITGAEN